MFLTWSSPLPSERNGIIIEYSVEMSDAVAVISQLVTNATSIEISTLMPFTTYFIAVSSSTKIGIGPFGTSLLFTTLEDGKVLYPYYTY